MNRECNKLKLAGLLLCVAVSAGALWGCGDGDGKSGEKTTAAEVREQESTEAKLESVETQDEESQSAESQSSESESEAKEFDVSDLYVIGNPLLSDCLFSKTNMSVVKEMEPELRHHSSEEMTDGHYIYEMGDAITYVTHSTMDGDLYGITLTSDQFQLGCGLRVGMKEEEIASLQLPFVPYDRESYPMDATYLKDMSCPFQVMDFDLAYRYHFERIAVTALVKDGEVIRVFTYILDDADEEL